VEDAVMKMSTHLTQRGLTMIVASLAICWFLASPEVVSAAEKKSSPAPMKESQAPGRLIIMRSPTLGPTVVGVRVDGVNVAQIAYNRRYDAPLSAGPHIVTVYPVHSMEGARPSQTKINAESGRTYSFTAVRQDIAIVLK